MYLNNYYKENTSIPRIFLCICRFSWCILFSHPADYTPVCTTELGKCVELEPEFKKRGVKMIALSCDDVPSHEGWSKVKLGLRSFILTYFESTVYTPSPALKFKMKRNVSGHLD